MSGWRLDRSFPGKGLALCYRKRVPTQQEAWQSELRAHASTISSLPLQVPKALMKDSCLGHMDQETRAQGPVGTEAPGLLLWLGKLKPRWNHRAAVVMGSSLEGCVWTPPCAPHACTQAHEAGNRPGLTLCPAPEDFSDISKWVCNQYFKLKYPRCFSSPPQLPLLSTSHPHVSIKLGVGLASSWAVRVMGIEPRGVLTLSYLPIPFFIFLS